MGGNALASQGAVRCEKDVAMSALSRFESEISLMAERLGLSIRVAPLRAYRHKTSFGDLDVLIESDLFRAMNREAIVDCLAAAYGKSLPFKSNGPVLSVGVPLDEPGKFIQVDMISTPKEEFDFAYEYFSWNDAGNLIGRIAHKMGLKFGHNGLWLPLREQNHLLGEVLITREANKAIGFLGFDVARWNQGFDTIDEIYEFIATSTRFCPSIFALENRNHTARVRDRKRPVYMGFLRWMEIKENKDKLNSFVFNPDKSTYLPEIFDAFPESKSPYQDMVEKNEKRKELKKIFNGELVSQWTGLKARELGQFMSSFKKEHPDMAVSFLGLPEYHIKALVAQHFEKMQCTPD